LMDLSEIGVFPGEELYDLDAGKELLEEFRTLVGEDHGLLAEGEQETHEPDLDGDYDEEDREASQSAGAQVDEKDDQADDQLDRSGPAHVEELSSKVDTRDVGGDVVDELSVGVDMASTSGEGDGFVVDRGDQTRTQQNTGAHGAVKEVVHGERCESLKEEEAEGETDALLDRRGFLSGAVGDIGTLGELDESLRGKCKDLRDEGRETEAYLDQERAGDEGDVGNKAEDASGPPKPEDTVVGGPGETGLFLTCFLSPFLLALLALPSD
jgi:hypothetical protein